MTANVVQLRADWEDAPTRAAAAFDQHLNRCSLSDNTCEAYRRQGAAYLAWLADNRAAHPDAFADQVGAEAAVTDWRRHLLGPKRAAPSSVNQALASVSLLYRVGANIIVEVKRARVARPGEPDALTKPQQGAVQRAADRRGPRDAAIIATLLGSGARVEECQRLAVTDVPLTARTGSARLWGKGDQVRTVPLPASVRDRLAVWLNHRGELLAGQTDTGELWIGRRGPLTTDGIVRVVLAVGLAAGIPGLRPHRCRHTYATRLREGGADPAQVQRLMGHASAETTARYFRAGTAEVAALVETALE